MSTLLGALLSLATAAGPAARVDPIDLSGEWRFQLDRDDVGERDEWFQRDLPHAITLPGVLTAQGFGDLVSMKTEWTGTIRDVWFRDPYYTQFQKKDNFRIPFWLQPARHYRGAAWYQRDIHIPEPWRGKRITLHLERPHWQTTVWLDDRRIGSLDSLGTAHDHVLGADIPPGNHRLTIRVDNRMIVDVGANAHSVSDHTQGNWNGIVGQLQLRATDPVWIEDLRVYPDVRKKTLDVVVHLASVTGKDAAGVLSLGVLDSGGNPRGRELAVPTSWTSDGGQTKCSYVMGEDCELWDEFNPTVYRLTVQLKATSPDLPYQDQRSVAFGMREIATSGSRITINGRPVFMRGTLECCIFPRTGHPPTDVESWRRIIRIAKAHGLNHIRFHSWCPPEAAFVAADKLGFYYQVECSAWAKVGDGGPFDSWLYRESDAMVRAYGNHPSFTFLAYGNEPAGPNQKRFLGDFVAHWKQRDPRRLYTSAAGWPIIPENDYHSSPRPRIQQWGDGLRSRVNAKPPETWFDYREIVEPYPDTPIISHEIGQWCVYPNLEEVHKYTGLLKAKNFEIFREQLAKSGMLGQARDLLMASGKLQALLYKEDIESALRTPGFGGFQLLDLHDFPGQGTALVGVLDAFWDEKGYISADEYRRFAGPVVPLARLKRRVFESGDRFEARVELAHFGPRDWENIIPTWTLRTATGDVMAEGQLPRQSVAAGSLATLGDVSHTLPPTSVAQMLNLEIAVPGTEARNDWDLWLFPKELSTKVAKDILVVREFGPAATDHLKDGGKLLLLPPSPTIKNDERRPLKMGFSSIFWNTVWTGGQAPHTLGILCDPRHPALDEFPTEYHSNWQWWELIHDAAPFILTAHRNVKPVVQVVDDWVTARKLALVFEARVGRGKLLACSADLVSRLDRRPVARQMRHSLLTYMASDQFDPDCVLTMDEVRDLLTEPSPLQRLGAKVEADSFEVGFEGANAIDGDPTTLWHTQWSPAPAPMPHAIILDLVRPVAVRGITCLPRQDMANGRIADYEVYVSDDALVWGAPAAKGTWDSDRQQKVVPFATPRSARYVKLVAVSEVNGRPFASIAELGILLNGS